MGRCSPWLRPAPAAHSADRRRRPAQQHGTGSKSSWVSAGLHAAGDGNAGRWATAEEDRLRFDDDGDSQPRKPCPGLEASPATLAQSSMGHGARMGGATGRRLACLGEGRTGTDTRPRLAYLGNSWLPHRAQAKRLGSAATRRSTRAITRTQNQPPVSSKALSTTTAGSSIDEFPFIALQARRLAFAPSIVPVLAWHRARFDLAPTTTKGRSSGPDRPQAYLNSAPVSQSNCVGPRCDGSQTTQQYRCLAK